MAPVTEVSSEGSSNTIDKNNDFRLTFTKCNLNDSNDECAEKLNSGKFNFVVNCVNTKPCIDFLSSRRKAGVVCVQTNL